MPMYEFQCDDCGHVFEKLRRLSDSGTPPCPQCESAQTQKKISGFVAKGGKSGSSPVTAAPRGFT